MLTAKNTTSRPNASQGTAEAITTVGSHGGLDDLKGLTKRSHLKHVQASAQQQVGEFDGLLLQLVLPIGTRRVGGCDHGDKFRLLKGALTKGRGCFFAGELRKKDAACSCGKTALRQLAC